jgi:hypothetical protein
MLEVSEKNIECDGWARMTQMRVAINGGTTHIHAHIGSMKGFENFLIAT